MKVVKISSKGQITIPRAVQEKMDVTYGSKVILFSEKDSLVIKPLRKSITEQTAGSLRKYVDPKKLGISFVKVREETHKLAAEEVVKKYERSSSR